MARKKKHPEHVNHERWLVSYADFITLLFAFFVVMFAASNSDNKKAGQVATAVQVAFREMAIFSPSGKVVPLYDEGGLPADTNTIIGNTSSGFEPTQFVDGKAKLSGKADLKEVKNEVEGVVKTELAQKSVRVFEDSRGLTISLAEAGFFPPGSATMPPK